MLVADKVKIKANFNKAANTYDKHCLVQKRIADHALSLLNSQQKNFNTIADFACGSGESTLRLIKQLAYKSCYAIDFAEDLLAVAAEKLKKQPNLTFKQADLEQSLFEQAMFDFIFCNMALQWVDLAKVLALFKHYLTAQGLVLFTLPVQGNFPEINSAHKLALSRHDEILTLLKQQQFTILYNEVNDFTVSFLDQMQLLKSLKQVGANYNKNKSTGLKKTKMTDIFSTSHADLTYRIGFYLVQFVSIQQI